MAFLVFSQPAVKVNHNCKALGQSILPLWDAVLLSGAKAKSTPIATGGLSSLKEWHSEWPSQYFKLRRNLKSLNLLRQYKFALSLVLGCLHCELLSCKRYEGKTAARVIFDLHKSSIPKRHWKSNYTQLYLCNHIANIIPQKADLLPRPLFPGAALFHTLNASLYRTCTSGLFFFWVVSFWSNTWLVCIIWWCITRTHQKNSWLSLSILGVQQQLTMMIYYMNSSVYHCNTSKQSTGLKVYYSKKGKA